MISSIKKAPRYGRGKLIVDGTDETLVRKAEGLISPTSRQEGQLLRLLRLGCETYNAALQERRDAWQMRRVRITSFDQFNQVPALRALGSRDDALQFGTQPLRGAIQLVDEAYTGFFRRVDAGGTPGYPRFRSHKRFDTIGWDTPQSWKLDLPRATLYLQGVGTIRLSRSAVKQYQRLVDRGGEPRTLTISRRASGRGKGRGFVWRAVVSFRNVGVERTMPTRGNGSLTGLDLGLTVTVADAEAELRVMPKFVRDLHGRIATLQRSLARKKKGSRSWRCTQRQVALLRRRATNQSRNWAWHTARDLVAQNDVLVLEELKLQQMMRSARGTKEEPGTNVAAKSGLNRALQEAALGRLRQVVSVKAEEAGRRVWLVPSAYTSQRCSACGYTEAANRSDRDVFYCGRCAHYEHADVNAGKNIRLLGAEAEVAWRAAGSPLLVRPKPRKQRRKEETTFKAT